MQQSIIRNTRNFAFILALAFFQTLASAQNARISDRNSIGWYNYSGLFKLNDKFGIHTEYQWRREKIISNWQQSVAKVGLNYQLHPNVQLRLGYGWIETFPYGDIPINALGKDFTEHRMFEMASISDKVSLVDLSHRFMLEQRWVGRYSSAELTREDAYTYSNRFRYMFRMQMPLKGTTIADKTPYIAVYDEILIGFGKNVNENIFDQNRFGALLGYSLNKTFKIEAGYINQTAQLGREINNKNVFQYNNGLIVNAIFNIDLTKKSSDTKGSDSYQN